MNHYLIAAIITAVLFGIGWTIKKNWGKISPRITSGFGTLRSWIPSGLKHWGFWLGAGMVISGFVIVLSIISWTLSDSDTPTTVKQVQHSTSAVKTTGVVIKDSSTSDTVLQKTERSVQIPATEAGQAPDEFFTWDHFKTFMILAFFFFFIYQIVMFGIRKKWGPLPATAAPGGTTGTPGTTPAAAARPPGWLMPFISLFRIVWFLLIFSILIYFFLGSKKLESFAANKGTGGFIPTVWHMLWGNGKTPEEINEKAYRKFQTDSMRIVNDAKNKAERRDFWGRLLSPDDNQNQAATTPVDNKIVRPIIDSLPPPKMPGDATQGSSNAIVQYGQNPYAIQN